MGPVSYHFFSWFLIQNLQLTGKKGVVQNVSGNMCTVYLYDEKREVSISVRNVKPGKVAKQDKVYIFFILTVSLLLKQIVYQTYHK